MVYVTQSGDMWDKIAHDILGSEQYMGALIRANYDWIDCVIFPAGVELQIPEIDDEQSEIELPSWRQGLDDEEDGLDEFEEEDDGYE
ncbi:MAG: tail protein X [Roseburia sp.]|nr:tail protein X [Roseburia sp.]